MAEQPPIVAEGSPQQLEVTIFAAYGLKHLNIAGDAPYCVCEVLHADPHHQKTLVQTQALKGTLEPVWNETFRLDPWTPNEPLEFGIWDKGLVGSKEEGTKIILDSDQFYPHGCEGELPIPGLEEARLHIRIVPLGPSEVEAPWAHESQGPIIAQGPPQTLEVSIISAVGLKHLNMTGDAPYVICEVGHADRHEKKVSCQTRAIKGTLEPLWDETHTLDPWRDGEPLTFTVYDKGALGSKTEGSLTVPSKYFSPHGFEGQVPLEGLAHSLLHVRIVPAGNSTANAPVQAQAAVALPTQVAIQAPSAYEAQIPTNPALQAVSTTHVPQAYPGAPAAAQLQAPPGGTLLQGDHPSGTLALTTLDNMHELAKKGFGPGKYIGINIGAETGELLPVEKLGSLQLATPTMYAHASGEPIVLAKDPKTAKPGELTEPPPQKLQISLLGATGLRHMNMTGDNMYCECKTKPLKPHGRPESCTTKPISKSLEPQWNEIHVIDPWHEGEQLQFAVYDKGVIGSKTEGRAVLHPEQFYPHGCEGELPLEGLDEAGLSVRVVPLGPSTKGQTAPAQAAVAGGAYQQAGRPDLFTQLDSNHDGQLSAEEFAQMQSQPAAYIPATYAVQQPVVVAPYSMPAAAGVPALTSTYGVAPAYNTPAYVMSQAAPTPAAPAAATPAYAQSYATPAAGPFPALATTYAAPSGEQTAQASRPSETPGYPPATTTYGAPIVPARPAPSACPRGSSSKAPAGGSVTGPNFAMPASQPPAYSGVPAGPLTAQPSNAPYAVPQPYAASTSYPQYGAPLAQQPTYAAPVQKATYSAPPAQQPTYAASTAQSSYAAPPVQQTIAAPLAQQPAYGQGPTQGTLQTTYGRPPPMMGQPQMSGAAPVAASFPGVPAYRGSSAAAPSFASAMGAYPPAFGAPAAFAGAPGAPCAAGCFPGGSPMSLFDQADKNHDGKLSREEFVAAYIRQLQAQGKL